MENPNSWTPATKVISQAIKAHDLAMANGSSFASLPSRIYHALLSAGFLNEAASLKPDPDDQATP